MLNYSSELGKLSEGSGSRSIIFGEIHEFLVESGF